MTDFISLFDLNNQVKQALKGCFTGTVWVTAEIASVQENRSGHCYLELVDKPEGEENPVAVAKATVWSFTYRMLKPYFETTTGRRLEKGMKVLINVEVVFHEVYGFSLNVKDIDPTFTIGDLERKRREIIEQLEKEGIIDMNRNLELPPLPKNVAVISSPTAAGLGDFLNQLENNSYGYKFHVKLFPAIMQGEKTTESVIAALERIYEYEDLFDVVVIIRGGGSQTDLGCFDSYDMAANIAQFPLPVIAGIGHERDETIIDRVAWKRVKTPTAAAAFLVEAFQNFDVTLEELENDFVEGVKNCLEEERNRQRLQLMEFERLTQSMLDYNTNRLYLLSHKLEHAFQFFIYNHISWFDAVRSRLRNRMNLLLNRETVGVEHAGNKLRQLSAALLKQHRYLLELADTKVKYVDPRNVLERGYAITYCNGKVVKSVGELKGGERLEILLKDGQITSRVEEIKIK